jgi:hypothetical protein
MANIKPYAGNSRARLIEMINRDNPDKTIVLGSDFSMGPPLEFSGSMGRNTKTLLTPLVGTPWKGPQDVFYTRLNIDVLSRLPEGFVDDVAFQALPFSIHGILPSINSALGLDLTKEEVADQTFTTAQESYPLVINQDASYAWRNSAYYFKFKDPSEDIDLAIAIAEGVLNGLEYIQP